MWLYDSSALFAVKICVPQSSQRSAAENAEKRKTMEFQTELTISPQTAAPP
jgi:hypothetical protein